LRSLLAGVPGDGPALLEEVGRGPERVPIFDMEVNDGVAGISAANITRKNVTNGNPTKVFPIAKRRPARGLAAGVRTVRA
jgi:hypothetical protein